MSQQSDSGSSPPAAPSDTALVPKVGDKNIGAALAALGVAAFALGMRRAIGKSIAKMPPPQSPAAAAQAAAAAPAAPAPPRDLRQEGAQLAVRALGVATVIVAVAGVAGTFAAAWALGVDNVKDFHREMSKRVRGALNKFETPESDASIFAKLAAEVQKEEELAARKKAELSAAVAGTDATQPSAK